MENLGTSILEKINVKNLDNMENEITDILASTKDFQE
jgi:hypothetical protein